MKRKLSGTDLTARIEEALGSKLDNPGAVALLFDTCSGEGRLQAFKELAMYAKSLQKIAKLLSTDRIDDAARDAAKHELGALLKRFSDLVESVASKLPDEKRDEVRRDFLLPTEESSANLRTLLKDFMKVKDFLLIERDKSSEI